MQLSVVTTLYNSSRYIDEFTSRIVNSLKELNLSYEIIFVDDGSRDMSASIVESIGKENINVKLIKFSRNFGHHIAMVCGLENASGEYVFLIDVDLEEKPELLIEFYHEIKKGDYDLIYGKQENRNKDKFLGLLFWKLLNVLTGLNLGINPCTVRMMTKQFVEKLELFPQRDFFLGELSSHIGFTQKSMEINKSYKGKSTYSFFKKYSLLFNMLFTNASNFWLKLSFLATSLSILAFVFFIWLLLNYILGIKFLNGWLSLMVMMTFFASINFFFFGLILQFLSKILEETRSKPRYIVKRKINF